MGLTLILPKRLAWKGNTSRGLSAGGGGPGKTGGRQSEAKGTRSCPGSGGGGARWLGREVGLREALANLPNCPREKASVGTICWPRRGRAGYSPPKSSFLSPQLALSCVTPGRLGSPGGKEEGEAGLGETQEQPSLPFASGLWSSYCDESALTDLGLDFRLKVTRGPFCYLRSTPGGTRPTWQLLSGTVEQIALQRAPTGATGDKKAVFCWHRGPARPHGRHKLRYTFRPPPRAWKLLWASHFGIFLKLPIRGACQGSPSPETPCSPSSPTGP